MELMRLLLSVVVLVDIISVNEKHISAFNRQ